MSMFERFRSGFRAHGPADDQVEHIPHTEKPAVPHEVKKTESGVGGMIEMPTHETISSEDKVIPKSAQVIDFEGPSQL